MDDNERVEKEIEGRDKQTDKETDTEKVRAPGKETGDRTTSEKIN